MKRIPGKQQQTRSHREHSNTVKITVEKNRKTRKKKKIQKKKKQTENGRDGKGRKRKERGSNRKTSRLCLHSPMASWYSGTARSPTTTGNVAAGLAQFTASCPPGAATSAGPPPPAAEPSDPSNAPPCVMACFTAGLSGTKGICGSFDWTSLWRTVPARSRTESSFSDSYEVGRQGSRSQGIN